MIGRNILRVQGSAAAILVVLTAFALWRMGHTYDDAHRHTLNAMTTTRHAQAELRQHTLMIRLGVLQSYDPLNDDITDLRRAQAQIMDWANTVVGKDDAITSAHAELTLATDLKAGLVEQYTSQVSKYRNSLMYLPIALDAWIRSSETGASHPDHMAAAQDLVRLALTYNATPTEAFRAQLAETLSRSEQLPQLSSATTRQSWTLLLRHTRIVLDVTEPLSDTLDQLLEPDISRADQSVHTAYMTAYSGLRQRQGMLRLLTYALVVVSGLLFADLILRIRRLYASLEKRIARRTHELAEVVAGSRRILDNVSEGLISVDLQGMPDSQASTALRKWLGAPGDAESIWQWLGRFDKELGQWCELGWEDLKAGFMPHDVVLDQLPNQVELNDQIIRIRYSPIIDDEGNLQRVLVIMHDITRQERAERKHAQDAEKLQVLMHVMNDRAGLGDCMEQTSDLLDQLQATTQDPLACKRHLHTLKGNVGMYDMQSMMACCHQIETRLQVNNTSVSLKDIEELREKWRYYEELVQPFYQADCAPSREAAQLKDIAGLIEQRAPYARLASTAASWNQESMALRLARLARQTQHTARRLEHQVDTCIQDNGLFTPLHTLDSLWAVVPHLIRNALDHGIEDPDVRAALGKPARGRIVLATRRAADTFVLSIRDDGAGIQWQALRDKAMKLGMPHTSRSELEAVLFADGISSKDTVSQFSGRGVGMAAVLQETVRRGGTVSVHSEPNVGTTIECAIPGIFHSMERMVG